MCGFTTKTETMGKKSKGQSVCRFLFLFEKSMILQWQGDIASLRWIQ